MDNELVRKIDVTAILFLLVQNRQQTHGWTLIGSGANGTAYRSGTPILKGVSKADLWLNTLFLEMIF